LQNYPPIIELQHLLSRTARQDQDAFEKLYRLTSHHLHGLALHMLRDADLARDVVQDAYVSIWRNAGEYDPGKSAPMTWMVSIARYRALDLLRKAQPMVRVEDAELLDYLDQAQDDRPAQAAGIDDCSAIQTCIGKLPSAQRQSIMLAYFRGLTHSELASHLRQPLGTVKSWVRQGLLQLKDCLGA
jgi:RNA polymerase sigma-70 factor, ECF subfamily